MSEINYHKRLVAVCGAGSCGPAVADLAYHTGRLLAENSLVLICGGLGGVMTSAARGAKDAGGLTVGFLPGLDYSAANPFIDLPLPTGLGEARNALITRAAQVIIALHGGPGTLSEVALGLKIGKPVIGLGAWSDISGVHPAATSEDAVRKAMSFLTPHRC